MSHAGFGMNDIRRIIFTHGHVDHFGLAASIRREAGRPVECFIHAEDRGLLSPKAFSEETFDTSTRAFLTAAGVPAAKIGSVRERFSMIGDMCDPVDDFSLMEDGDEFEADGCTLRVIHTPGHTAGCCCIHEPGHKLLFSGDHILKHITPNPLVVLRREHLRDPRYRSLTAYSASLEKVRRLDLRFVFPGHGDHIDDLPTLVSMYRKGHRVRKEIIWKALEGKARPVYDIIDEVFPFMPGTELFLAVSEIVSHLEVLMDEGHAAITDPGPPVLYRSLP